MPLHSMYVIYISVCVDGVYFTESRYYVNWDPINIKNAFVYNMSDAITIRRDLFKKV